MTPRPQFYSHDPAINGMALARVSTLAKGVDAVLGDLAWLTDYPGCRLSLEAAARACPDVPDLVPVLEELVAAGRWRVEGTTLVSLYLLDRSAEILAFKAAKAAAGAKGGTKKAQNAAARASAPVNTRSKAQPVVPQEVVAVLAVLDSANHCQPVQGTPYPEQYSSSFPLSEEKELQAERHDTIVRSRASAAPAASHAGGASGPAEDPPSPLKTDPRPWYLREGAHPDRLAETIARWQTTPPSRGSRDARAVA